MNEISRQRLSSARRKGSIVIAFSIALLSLFLTATDAGPVDLNGNALPDPSDGKSVAIDNSKDKEAPPIVTKGCVTPSDTEFRIGIPGWMPGLSGDVGVAGIATEQDIKFKDILKRLDMIALGSFYARYQRWEFFGDGLYMKLHDTAPLRGILFESARVSLKSAIAEAFVGYRLINCESASLSLYAGGRYSYMSGDFHLRGARLASRRATGDTDWIDPAVGAAGRVRIWKAISLWAKGDVGGFDANSDSAFELKRTGPLTISRVPIESDDWSYQVQGGVGIQATRWIYSEIGWRYLKYDYTSAGFTNKAEMSGPYIETGVNF